MNATSLIRPPVKGQQRVTQEQLTAWLGQLRQVSVETEQAEDLSVLLPDLLQVCGWHGEARALHDAMPAGTLTLEGLLGTMVALGYELQVHTGTLKALDAGLLPGLFVPRQGRAFVVSQLSPELPTHATGAFYQFRRRDAAQGLSDTATPWLRQIMQRLRPLLWHAALLSLVMHIFSLAMPLFSMAVYDRVIAAQAPGTLPLLAAGVMGAFVTEMLLRAIRGRIVGWVSARAENMICQSMFERLLFLPPALIEQASVSSQLARVRAFEAVRDFIGGPMFLIALELPFIFVLVLVMALFAGPVAIVPVAMVMAYILLLALFRPYWQKLGAELAHSAAVKQQQLMEIVEHARPIFAAGISTRLLSRYDAVSRQASTLQYRYGLTVAVLQHLASFLTVAAAIITINWCLARIWAGEMSAGAMVASMIITWRLLYPLQALCNIMPNYEQVRASVRQVAQLMNLQPETHAWRHALGRREITGRVEFQNVGLRYNRKSDPVFLGLNARIAQGELVAIFGGNGCGKSSILRLLLGLYAPAMGAIRIDGIDHRQLDPRTLRRHIAYLPQVAEFLPGTVADNLRFANPLAADYQLRQALLWADALDLVEALPQGMETQVSDQAPLSSGLASRIILARLYLSEQPIVLCDELPSQLLNSETGERFRKFLEECRGKRTVFFVTHREDWLNMADQVIWLKPEAMPVVGRPGGRVPPPAAAPEEFTLNDLTEDLT